MIHADFWGSLILMGLSMMAFIGGWSWRGLWDRWERRRRQRRYYGLPTLGDTMRADDARVLRELGLAPPPAIPPGEGVK